MAENISDTEIYEKLAKRKDSSDPYDLLNRDSIILIEDTEQLLAFIQLKLPELRSVDVLEEKRILPQLKKMGAIKEVLKRNSDNKDVVIRGGLIMIDEPDNLAKNDEWGKWHVFSFLALKSKHFGIELMLNPVSTLMH